MQTTHELTTFFNGSNGYIDVAIFARPVTGQYATEETWTITKRVAPKTGRVREIQVQYYKKGAVTPGALSFTSERKALRHVTGISGVRKVA